MQKKLLGLFVLLLIVMFSFEVSSSELAHLPGVTCNETINGYQISAYNCSAAIDNNYGTTYLNDGGLNANMTVNLTGSYNIHSVWISPESDWWFDNGSSYGNIYVWASNDGASFSLVGNASISSALPIPPWRYGEGNTSFNFTPILAKYIRVQSYCFGQALHAVTHMNIYDYSDTLAIYFPTSTTYSNETANLTSIVAFTNNGTTENCSRYLNSVLINQTLEFSGVNFSDNFNVSFGINNYSVNCVNASNGQNVALSVFFNRSYGSSSIITSPINLSSVALNSTLYYNFSSVGNSTGNCSIWLNNSLVNYSNVSVGNYSYNLNTSYGAFNVTLSCVDALNETSNYSVQFYTEGISITPSSAAVSKNAGESYTELFIVENLGSNESINITCVATGVDASWVYTINPSTPFNLTPTETKTVFYSILANSTTGVHLIPIVCTSLSGATDSIDITVTINDDGGGGGGGGGGGFPEPTATPGYSNILEINPSRIDVRGNIVINEFQGNNHACSLSPYTMANLHPSLPLTINFAFSPESYISQSSGIYNYANIIYLKDSSGNKINGAFSLGEKENKEIYVCVESSKPIDILLDGEIVFTASASDSSTEVERLSFAIQEKFVIGGFDILTIVLLLALFGIIGYVFLTQSKKKKRSEY